MSFACTLYTFNKERNSTRRPQNLPAMNATSYVGVFVYDFSLVHPVVRITNYAPNSTITPFMFNYMHISQLQRYYFIDNWVILENGMYEAHCTEDVLASFYTEIVNSKAYIQRCSMASTWNPAIADTFYPTTLDYIMRNISHQPSWAGGANTNRWTGFATDFSNCTYVLGIVSGDDTVAGAVDYYVIDRVNLATLVETLVSNFNLNQQPSNWKLEDLSSSMLKSLVSPMQYIKSCIAIPITLNYSPGTAEHPNPYYRSIRAATWDTGAKGYRLVPGDSQYGYIKQVSYDLRIPNLESDSEYLAYPPYAEYTLYNTMFGAIPLDGMVCSMVDTLRAVFEVNIITGELVMEIYTDSPDNDSTHQNPYMLTRQVINPSVNIPLAEVTYNYVQIVKDIGSTIETAADKFSWVTNTVGNAKKLLDNVLDVAAGALSPTVTSSGSQTGSFSNRSNQFHVQARFFKPFSDVPARFGFAVKQHGRIYRYISTETNAKVFLSASDVELITHYTDDGVNTQKGMLNDEREMIIAMLAEGVFFENTVYNDAYT